MFLVEYNGDIERGKDQYRNGRFLHSTSWTAQDKCFETLEKALEAISSDFPLWSVDNLWPVDNEVSRETPDVEDDRIVVWYLEAGKKKEAVWAFCGWHWSLDDLGLAEQGTLPGDENSLYGLANG